jgi:dipeptidyl aminopeptidase/acylaminoacyl peptidase
MAVLKYCFILILLTLTLSACGGGGGGDENNQGGGGDDIVPDNQNINAGLTGKIYIKEQGIGSAVDLGTGIPSQLPSKNLWDTGDYNGYSVYFHPFPNRDGSEILLFVDGCFREFEGRTYDFDCLSFIDAAGNSLTEKVVFDNGIMEARQSRDGNYVAVVYADEYYLGPPAKLIILNRNMTEVVSQSVMRRVTEGDEHRYKAGPLDWAPNGQVVYSYAKSLFITSPYSSESVPLLTLPDSETVSNDLPEPGAPSTPKISPDGTKVAFRYVTESNLYQVYATIWVLIIDGTDVHQLAHDPDALYQMFNNLAWSPDGKYIITKAGGFGSDPLTGGAQNKLYAIPSNSRNVPLDCDGSGGVICVRTYFDSPNRLTDEFHPDGSEFEWIE